jgi:hypothetical protein
VLPLLAPPHEYLKAGTENHGYDQSNADFVKEMLQQVALVFFAEKVVLVGSVRRKEQDAGRRSYPMHFGESRGRSNNASAQDGDQE